jgi:lysophospholipase L1-like esterase
MIDCLIIGDSIAVGTKAMRPDCVAIAKGGINSNQWRKQYLDGDQGSLPLAETLIISLGSNDHKGVNTKSEIARIRTEVTAKRVYWILPAIKPEVQAAVREVADGFGDIVLEIKGLSTDGVHPTGQGYKQIAKEAK